MADTNENFEKIIAEIEQEENPKKASKGEVSEIDDEVAEIEDSPEEFEDGGGIDPTAGMDDAVGLDDGGLGDGGLDDGGADGLDDGGSDGVADDGGSDDAIIEDVDVNVEDDLGESSEVTEPVAAPKNYFENVLGGIFNWYE